MSHMIQVLICVSILFYSSLAAIHEDDEVTNKIPELVDLRADRDDEEMVACEAKDGCGFESNDYVPHSPLVPCDRLSVRLSLRSILCLIACLILIIGGTISLNAMLHWI